MKGVIVMCLSRMIIEKFSKEKWVNILVNAGLPENSVFLAGQNIDDDAVLKVLDSVCNELEISLIQAADAFGEYWVNSFASKIYKDYYKKPKTAKEFLLKMDDVHEEVTKSIPDAKPPKFSYKEVDMNTLLMSYESHRGLIDFLVGLVKGVGIYFNEPLFVTKLSDAQVKIVFNK